MAPYNGKRPRNVNDTSPSEVKPKTPKSQNKEKYQASDSESKSDVEMGTSETSDSRVKFADPTYPESELVPDMLSESGHLKLDMKVLRRYPWVDDDEQDDHAIYSRVTLLRSLVRDCDQLNRQYGGSYSYLDIRKLFHKHRWLISVLDECWRKGSFRAIRLLRILQGTNTISSRSWTPYDHDEKAAQEKAVVERSWDREFEGPAADVLLQTISTYLTERSKSKSSNCSPIVNSSGTGKSRMVDQLSKRVITVPMCLRGPGSNGFPPPDDLLREWLPCGLPDRPTRFQKLHQFIYSLLTVTKERLQRFEDDGASRNDLNQRNAIKRQERLARVFRERMTEDQKFGTTGQYRQEFFEEVIDRAEDYIHVEKGSENLRCESFGFLLPKPHEGGVQQAGEELINFIFSSKAIFKENGLRRPLVILSFDDAHQLADVFCQEPILLSELRRVLSELNGKPIFGLFLSTAANTLKPYDIQDLPPITETSFDALAYIAEEGVTTLDEVAQDRWMSHLGRPLFAVDYDSGASANDLLSFAEHKLLCGDICRENLTPDRILAFLSVRFALDIDVSVPGSRSIADTQVERHLRLCSGASPGFDDLFTFAGSEPFLAEAAVGIMACLSSGPAVELLATHPHLSFIDCGRRGELAASLIIMEAKDLGYTNRKWDTHTCFCKWVYVRDFMRGLLPEDAYETLISTLPSCYLPGGQNTSFEATFNDSKIWFNHIIKVEHDEMIHVSHLWKFVSRGAMIICPPGHCGMDIVIPVCFKGNALTRENMTAILIQIKPDKRHFSGDLFGYMDPFDAGLFSDGDAPLPVIRMVFALGSDDPDVSFPIQEKSPHANRFSSYDIWCEGLSPRTFPCVGEDLSSYEALLERSLQGSKLYDLVDVPCQFPTKRYLTGRGDARRRARQLAGHHPAHNEKYKAQTH